MKDKVTNEHWKPPRGKGFEIRWFGECDYCLSQFKSANFDKPAPINCGRCGVGTIVYTGDNPKKLNSKRWKKHYRWKGWVKS